MALINQVIEEAKKQKATNTTKVNKMTPTGGLANKVKTSVPKTVAPVAPTPNVSPKTNGVTNVLNKVKEKQEAKASAATNILNKVKENKPVTNTGLTPNKGKSEILKNLRPQEETSEELKSVTEQLNKNYKINPYSALYDPNTQALEQRRQELMNEEKLQSEKKDLVTIPEYQKAYEEALAKGDKEEANRLNEIIDALDDSTLERVGKSFSAAGRNAFADIMGSVEELKDISYEKDALGYEEQYKRALAEGNTEEAEYYKQRAEESRKRADSYDALDESHWSVQLRNESQKIMELERIGASGTDMLLMETGDNIANMLPTVAASAIPGVGSFSMAVFVPQVFSSVYANNINNGYDIQTSASNAALSAAVEFVSEEIGTITGFAIKNTPLNNVFSRVMDTSVGRMWGAMMANSIIQDPISEGNEELFSGLIQPIIDHYTLGTDIEYSFGDLSHAWIMGALTSAIMNTPQMISTHISSSRQANFLKAEMEMIDEAMPEGYEQANSIARRIAENALAEFREKSITADAIKLESEQAEVPSVNELLVQYAEFMKPTEDAYQRKLQESVARLNEYEQARLDEKGINLNSGVWAMLDSQTKQDIESFAEKNLDIDYADYITHDTNYRKAMVEVAENGYKGLDGKAFDAGQYMKLTEAKKQNLKSIQPFVNSTQMNLNIGRLAPGVGGYIASDNTTLRLNPEDTRVIEPSKLADLNESSFAEVENILAEYGDKIENDTLTDKERKDIQNRLRPVFMEAGQDADIYTTAIHETGHYTESTGTWNVLRDQVKAEMGEERFNRAVERLGEVYKALGVKNANAEHEVVTHYLQANVNDPNFLSKMARYNQSSFYRLYNNLSSMLKGDAKSQIENTFMRAVRNANNAMDAELGVQYSAGLRQDGSRKDLRAQHNLSADNLSKALDIGGLIMPSTAVTKDSIPHEGYGDITLVFDKDTIDPSNPDNEVFTRDAWTPTFPAISYKLSNKAYKIRDSIEQLVSKSVDPRSIQSVMVDDENFNDLMAKNKGSIADSYKDSLAMKIAYLNDTGDTYQMPTKGGNLGSLSRKPDNFIRKSAEALKDYDLSKIDYYSDVDSEIEDKLSKLYHDYLYDDYYNRIKEKPNHPLYKNGSIEERAERLASTSMEHTWTPFSARDVVDDVKRYLERGEYEVPDIDKAREELSYLENDENFHKWIEKTMDGIIEKKGIRNQKDTFTKSGNRRSFEALHDPYTPEGILKNMKEQEHTNSFFGFSNFNYFLGVTSGKFNNVGDIISREGSLQPNYNNEQYDALADRYSDFVQKVRGNRQGSGDAVWDFVSFDGVMDEAIKKINRNADTNSIIKTFKDYRFNVSADQVNELRSLIKDGKELTTDYFEAKPRRIVRPNEWKQAYVPNTTDPNLIQRLKDLGVEVIEYDKNIPGDRQAKMNGEGGTERYQFSKGISPQTEAEYDQAVANNDMETAQRLVDEVAKKNGYTIKAYHGTRSTFDKFSRGKQGENYKGYLRFGAGFYFTPSAEEAKQWIKRNAPGDPNVMSVYLKADRILDANSPIREATKDLIAQGYSKLDAEFITERVSRYIDHLIGELGYTNEEVQDQLISYGYDAIDATIDGKSGEYIVFYPEHIKSADAVTYDDNSNVIPLSERFNEGTDNIRYSKGISPQTDSDSQGRKLSNQQREYFKDSKAVDDNGNLLTLYHGTPDGGFSVFDSSYSKDKRSLFFTDDPEVADTYNGGRNRSSIYPVYLNLKNPLIIDAKGASWNNIQNGEIKNLVADRNTIGDFTFMNEDDANSFEQKYHIQELTNLLEEAEKNGSVEYNGETYDDLDISSLLEDARYKAEREYQTYHRNNSKRISIREFLDNYKDYGWYDLESLQDAYDDNGPSLLEIKESVDNDYDKAVKEYIDFFKNEIEEGNADPSVYDITFDALPKSGESFEKMDLHNTRWFSEQAQKQGYDGVIIKNLVDRVYGNGASTVAIAYDSNQVKSIFNTNPTSNKDIRYSMGIDNSGYHYGSEDFDVNKKSEKLWQRSNRGTGAFGTGTYFFGEGRKNSSFPKGKTEHKVDFSDYNLFKVKDADEGWDLHDYLNRLDNLYGDYGTPFENRTSKDYNAEVDYLVNSVRKLNEDPLLAFADEFMLESIHDDIARIESDEFADKVIEKAREYAEDDGTIDVDYLADVIRDEFDNDTPGRRRAGQWSQLQYFAPRAAKVLGIDEQTLKDLSNKAMAEAKADRSKSDFIKGNYDSVGTRVMKALGYEGIDVRGVKELDNSTYGSVIYDLKPETVQYSMGLKPEQTVRLKSGKIPAKVGKIIQKAYDAFDEGYSNDMEQFGVSYEDVADEFLDAANEVATNGEISKETMDRLRDILYYGVENVYEPGERGKDVYEQIKDILKTHPLSNSAIGQKYVDYGADGKKHMTRLHKGMTQGTLNDMRRNGIRFKNGGYDLGELESVFKEAGLGQYFDERTFSDLEDFNKTLSDLQLTLQNQTHKSYDMAEFADETEESFNQFFDETMKQFVEDVSGKQMSDQAAEVIDSLDVSDEEFNKFVKRDPISPRALENITKHKKELVDTAPEWIPNYDIIREKHPEFTDLEMNDALFEILSEGTISESTAWRIKEDMLRRNSVQTNNEADQSIKDLVDDSLDYFAADAAYKMNKKAMNSVANKANTIIRSFTGQNVTESALDSYEQMEGLEKTLKQVEKRRGEVSAKNETMVKELLAAGADYGSSWMTLEQNLDKIAGTNSNLRQTLRDYFELPKYESQIKYVQFLQKYGDTLQGLVKDGIRAGTKESAAVQYMLEGHTEDGAKYGQKELMEQFPKTWEKLDKAAKTLRNMYDEMYNLIETNRENTYGDIDAKYDLQLAKARDKANNARRTADQIKQKLGEKADARLEAMYNRADAQASKLERQYEQMLEDKATRDGTRRQKLQYRKNYAHHLTDQGGFFKQMKNALNDGSSVPTKLSGISNRAKPLSGFASFFQRQNAQTGYVADAIGGMAEYIKDASKIYAYDPYIEYLRFAASDIRAEASGNEMSRFVSWVDNYANGIAGKTQMLDRGIRETFGEKPLKVIKTLNNQARKNAIVGNLSTALVQFANLPNAIGVLSQYGGSESALDIARGLSAYASTLGREGAESVSPFMSARYYDINTMKGNVAQRSLNGIAKTLLEFGDHEAAKMIWNCSYQQALRLNVDDPVMYADDLTRRSVAGRSVSELPLAMESQVLKLLMPFQVETNNTFHLMTGLMRDKKLGSLLAMLIGGWLMNGLYEAVIGRRPITDPIDAIIDGAQSDNPADIATRLGGELLSAIPGSSYAVSLFGLNDNQRKKLFGENDPSRYGTGNIGLSTLGSATMDLYNAFDKKDPRYAMNAVSDLASTYLAPGGGRQIQRTVEGLQSEGILPQYVSEYEDGKAVSGEFVNEPRYYTPSGKVGFVNDPNDIFDVITAGTFGRWATKAGKEYLENGGKYLSDQATRQLEALGGDQAAYDAVIAMRDMQGIPGVDNSKALQKRKYLEDQGLWDTFAENMDGEWGDYGLNKTVGNASEEEFNKLYSETFGNEDMRLDVASAAGMKETFDTEEKESKSSSKSDANLDFLAGTPYEKAAIQNLDMDEDVLQTVTDLGYDYKTIKQIDDYIDNTDSLRKDDGSAIRNTKALQMRQYYEEMGVYDDIFQYISENGLDPQDYGLNKTVMGYSDAKFESQYNKYYGGGSSSSSKSSGSSSSGSSRKSSGRRKSSKSKKKGFSSEEEMKAFFDQLVANIGLSSSKSSTSAINNILKKSKNLRNTKFSKRSSS